MNNQQQAQAHKRQYKAKARLNRTFAKMGFHRGAGIVIDVPNEGYVPLIDKLDSTTTAKIIEEFDRLTDGSFSRVMTECSETKDPIRVTSGPRAISSVDLLTEAFAQPLADPNDAATPRNWIDLFLPPHLRSKDG